MIKEKLLELPSKIEDCKIRILEMRFRLSEIKEDIRKWENAELSVISDEVDDKGKVKFSNEAKRYAELSVRKELSEEFNELYADFKNLEYEVSSNTIHLERLMDEQSNLKAICRLGED